QAKGTGQTPEGTSANEVHRRAVIATEVGRSPRTVSRRLAAPQHPHARCQGKRGRQLLIQPQSIETARSASARRSLPIADKSMRSHASRTLAVLYPARRSRGCL